MNAVHQVLSYDGPIIDGLGKEVAAHTTRITALESKLETITKTLAAIMLELDSLRKPEPREPIERIDIDGRHLPTRLIPDLGPIIDPTPPITPSEPGPPIASTEPIQVEEPVRPNRLPEQGLIEDAQLEAIKKIRIISGTPQPNLPGRPFPDPQTTNEGDK
jgi:hypothetical protein